MITTLKSNLQAKCLVAWSRFPISILSHTWNPSSDFHFRSRIFPGENIFVFRKVIHVQRRRNHSAQTYHRPSFLHLWSILLRLWWSPQLVLKNNNSSYSYIIVRAVHVTIDIWFLYLSIGRNNSAYHQTFCLSIMSSNETYEKNAHSIQSGFIMIAETE